MKYNTKVKKHYYIGYYSVQTVYHQLLYNSY